MDLELWFDDVYVARYYYNDYHITSKTIICRVYVLCSEESGSFELIQEEQGEDAIQVALTLHEIYRKHARETHF